jgi:hypothetical protein
MKNKKQTLKNNRIIDWLLYKPLLFAISTFIGVSAVVLLYAFIVSMLTISKIPLAISIIAVVLGTIYYMIKKLPHDEMPRQDFIAITNGASLISVISSIIAVSAIGFYGAVIQQKMMMMFLLHQTAFSLIMISITLLSLYILGVAISGIYAKYKRVTTMGITPWKAILSMPFTFLMLWTPGYLIEEKAKKSNMSIKSKWYTRFNNWVMANFSNTLFVFLFLLFAKSVIAGLSSSILTLALLIIYTLWYVKHKQDFVKNINDGYALTSVGINIAIVLAVIISLL